MYIITVAVYVCAVLAHCKAVSDPATARLLGNASIDVSVAGIIFTALVVGTLIAVSYA